MTFNPIHVMDSVSSSFPLIFMTLFTSFHTILYDLSYCFGSLYIHANIIVFPFQCAAACIAKKFGSVSIEAIA